MLINCWELIQTDNEYEHISDSLNTAVKVFAGFRGYHSCMHRWELFV